MNIKAVMEAKKRLRKGSPISEQSVLLPTPLLRAVELENQSGCGRVFLKPENLQRTGSYKVRGAYSMMSLHSTEARKRGVITASAGNHAQGFAYAASQLGIKGTVLMPEDAPLTKRVATEVYGKNEESVQLVTIEDHFKDYDEAAAEAEKRSKYNNGPILIPAFDAPEIIVGQGTVAYEALVDSVPVVRKCDAIILPVGGGGLLGGTALVVQGFGENIDVWGVQSEANSAFHRTLTSYRENGSVNESLYQSGTQPTVADGIKVGRPGQTALNIVKDLANVRTLVVSELEIIHAMVFLFERCHLLVEGAGAAGVAALLYRRGVFKFDKQSTVVIIISGGNVDLNRIPHLIEHSLIHQSRYTRLLIDIKDRPGSFHKFIEPLNTSASKINILGFRRVQPLRPQSSNIFQSQVELLIETKNEKEKNSVIEELRSAGNRVEDIGR